MTQSRRRGICGICPAGCWVEVGLRDGRLVDIQADAGHPLGMICRRGQHAPEIVYSEHRLKTPLRRKGPRGTLEFAPISWDEAYDVIVERLAGIAHEGGALFHTDAVQAVGKVGVDVAALDVDLLSLSGHKIHAPKGIGALYVRKGIALEPLIHGGGQEARVRGGTENVPSIVGLGRAAELAVEALRDDAGVAAQRDRLEAGIRDLVVGAVLNGHPARRLPNTLNMTLPGIRGESLAVALDQHGVSLSSGSACKSGSPEPTHVLLAMGKTVEEAHCAVRFSLSRDTTAEEIDRTLLALAGVLREMETTVRFLPCK